MSDLHQVQFVFDKSCQIDTMVEMINVSFEPYHISFLKDDIKWLADSPLSITNKDDSVKFASSLSINIALPFKDVLKVEETPNIVAARKRYDTAKSKYDKCNADSAVVNFKYDFIACPHCASKLNKKYLQVDSICPLCHNDLRKESVLAKLSALRDKIDLCKDLLNLEISKNIEQGKFVGQEKWLIILYVNEDIPVERWNDFDFSSIHEKVDNMSDDVNESEHSVDSKQLDDSEVIGNEN